MLVLRRNGRKQKFTNQNTAGNITQWFCRAIRLCINSVKICAAIMVKVTFEIKSNISFESDKKKSFTGRPGDLFFAMRVIGNEQFFKVGLRKKKLPLKFEVWNINAKLQIRKALIYIYIIVFFLL